MAKLSESWDCNCDFEWKNTIEGYEFNIVQENDEVIFDDPNQQEINFTDDNL